jgi:hypothetical protein
MYTCDYQRLGREGVWSSNVFYRIFGAMGDGFTVVYCILFE